MKFGEALVAEGILSPDQLDKALADQKSTGRMLGQMLVEQGLLGGASLVRVLARQLGVMIAAVIIALIFMLVFAGRISDFIHRHPTLKMLALSFLLLIGCALVAEGFHKEIPKGYIYFAMAFSVGVESLNLRMRARQKNPPIELHQPYR